MITVQKEHPSPSEGLDAFDFHAKSNTKIHWKVNGPQYSCFLGRKHSGCIKAILEALEEIHCTGEVSIHATSDSTTISGLLLGWDFGSTQVARKAISLINDELRIINGLDIAEYEFSLHFVLTREIVDAPKN